MLTEQGVYERAVEEAKLRVPGTYERLDDEPVEGRLYQWFEWCEANEDLATQFTIHRNEDGSNTVTIEAYTLQKARVA